MHVWIIWYLSLSRSNPATASVSSELTSPANPQYLAKPYGERTRYAAHSHSIKLDGLIILGHLIIDKNKYEKKIILSKRQFNFFYRVKMS